MFLQGQPHSWALLHVYWHPRYLHSWHLKGLISIGMCVLMSSCVTFYLAFGLLAFFYFLMKFCKEYLYEVWHSLQTHVPHFGTRRSLLSYPVLEGSYRNR